MATAELELLASLDASYRQQSAKVESTEPGPTPPHVEEAVTLGLYLYDRLKYQCRRWSIAVEQQAAPFDEADSRAFSEQFSAWLETSRSILQSVRRLQQADPAFASLAGLRPFEEAVKDVSLMSLGSDRVAKSIASLQSGKGVPFERAMEELRAHLR